MVSLSTSVQVVVEREPADVWAYVSDLRNQDHWVDGMSDSEILSDGPIGVGTEVRGMYTMGSRATEMLMIITEFREGRELAFESTTGPFPAVGRLTLERSGGATLVTNQMSAGSDHVFTSIMFTVFRPLAKLMFTRQLRKELAQLKGILESG